MKDLSKIIREFEIFPYKLYDSRRPKYDPTDSYFYLSIQLAKCMMRADFLNSKSLPCKSENEWYKIYSNLARFFYRR